MIIEWSKCDRKSFLCIPNFTADRSLPFFNKFIFIFYPLVFFCREVIFKNSNANQFFYCWIARAPNATPKELKLPTAPHDSRQVRPTHFTRFTHWLFIGSFICEWSINWSIYIYISIIWTACSKTYWVIVLTILCIRSWSRLQKAGTKMDQSAPLHIRYSTPRRGLK